MDAGKLSSSNVALTEAFGSAPLYPWNWTMGISVSSISVAETEVVGSNFNPLKLLSLTVRSLTLPTARW